MKKAAAVLAAVAFSGISAQACWQCAFFCNEPKLITSWSLTDAQGNLHEYGAYAYVKLAAGLDPSNGMNYTPRSWTESNAKANEQGLHLATITSQAEQDAMAAALNGPANFNNVYGNNQIMGVFFLGAYQGQSSTTNGNWNWVNNSFGEKEVFSYNNWHGGEPNDGDNWENGAEQYAVTGKGVNGYENAWWSYGWNWQWADDGQQSYWMCGYIAEKETRVAVPEPGVLSLLGIGLLSLVGLKRRKSR